MKTTLDLPDELIRAVKLQAVMQGRNLKDLVADFLRQGLGITPLVQPEQYSSSSLVTFDTNGLPVIRCGQDAPAKHMTLSELLDLEQETQTVEDLRHAGITI